MRPVARANEKARHPVRSVALLGKAGNAAAAELSAAARRWFGEGGVSCAAFAYTADDKNFVARLGDADLVIVLGGDGTLVSVARHLAASPRPIIGVNLGRVGFLAEISPDAWESACARIMRDGVMLETGLALRYSLTRDGEGLCGGLAVNDIVISRGGPARLVSLELAVEGARLAVMRADGLIVSTPTGSTGYTGSARGPLLYPGIDAYVVTALCPFLGNFLPMVLPSGTGFSVTVDEAGPESYLTVDGQEALRLTRGDRLEARGEPDCVCFARLDGEGYFAKLRSAGFVRDFGGQGSEQA